METMEDNVNGTLKLNAFGRNEQLIMLTKSNEAESVIMIKI